MLFSVQRQASELWLKLMFHAGWSSSSGSGVIPDYRAPDGIRTGLAPLSTSFAEVIAGLAVLRDLLAR